MVSFHSFVILLLSSSFYQLIQSESENVSISTTDPDVNSYTNATTVNTTRDDPSSSTPIIKTTNVSTTVINPIGNPPINLTIEINETISSSSTATAQFSILANVTSTGALGTTTDMNDNRPAKSFSRSRFWLISGAIVAFVVIFLIAIIYYRRQRTSYSRFLQNWQTRDDGVDNMNFQLEEPDISYRDWPHRLVLT